MSHKRASLYLKFKGSFPFVKHALFSIIQFYLALFFRSGYLLLSHIGRLTLFVFVVVTLILLPGQNIYKKALFAHDEDQIWRQKLPVKLPEPAPYPINKHLFEPPSVTASGVIIADLNSGVILYEKNSHERFQPASTTKIMTALVALDTYRLDTHLIAETNKIDGRTMGLFKGEKLTVEALLYGLMIHSANDAAIVLAENYPGGTANFVKAMNEKSKQLHLDETHFTNPVGYEDPDHYISARDLARLSSEAIKNPTISKIVSIRSITVSDVSYSHYHDLTNVNQLIGKIPGVAGLKTGWTENARECLVTLQLKGKVRVLTVVLRSNDRFAETEKLLGWVGQNFSWESVERSPSPTAQPSLL